MKVTCSGCGWSADVPEEKIPEAGARATCPKCKSRFHVWKKPPVGQPPGSQTQSETVGVVKGAALGFLSGSAVSLSSIFMGVFICCIPVIGWVVGSLLIIFGVFAPFVGTLVGGITGNAQIEIKGLCPYCGGNLQTIVFNNQNSSICCLLCQHRVVVKENEFVGVG